MNTYGFNTVLFRRPTNVDPLLVVEDAIEPKEKISLVPASQQPIINLQMLFYYCFSSLNLVTITLLMFINPSDATVYMEFNRWVVQLLVGLRNSPVLKSI